MPAAEPRFSRGDIIQFHHPLHGVVQGKVRYIEDPGILEDDEWVYVIDHEGRRLDALEDEIVKV